jgi:hypothetical protein
MNYEGFFNIIDYSLTHNILLLRTYQIVEESIINTDLKFKSVFYIEIPSYFDGLYVENGTPEDCEYVLNRCDPEFVSTLKSEHVFVLITNRKKYFIGARLLVVENNNLGIGETSISFKKDS